VRLYVNISFLVAAVAAIVTAATFLALRPIVGDALRRENRQRAEVIAALLAGRVADAVLAGNKLAVREAALDVVRRTHGVAYAYVVGFDDEIVSHSFAKGFPRALLPERSRAVAAASPELSDLSVNGEPVIDAAYPLVDRMPAHVHVGLSERQVQEDLRVLLRRLLVQGATLAALAALAGVVLSLRVARPLVSLTEAMRRFGEGEADVAPPVSTGGVEVRALAGAFGRMIAARRKAEELLAAEKEQLSVTLRSIGDGVIAVDTDGRVTLINGVAETLTGCPSAEALGRELTAVFNIVSEKTREPCVNPAERVLRTGSPASLANHTALISRDGTVRSIADSAAPIRDRQDVVRGVVLVFRDVSHERVFQEELLRAEKLRSVGVLAAGIAHDFNNLLTVITGHLSLATLQAADNPELADDLRSMEQATLRARDLTQQLLTFARGGAPIRRATSLRDVLRDTAQFALRGAKVDLALEAPEELWPAEIDAGQISQVVQNLVINADQAMPNGGRITLRAGNLQLSGDERLPLRPGRYVHLCVEDQGAGIPSDVLPRIFDPFFTTKKEGSGLGLATAYSVVRNHDGHIAVESEPGAGARFHVYLPATEKTVERGHAEPGPAPRAGGPILLMDDEESVRKIVGRMLERLGYSVSRTSSGQEAVAAFAEARRSGNPFRAVVLDLTVPGGMGGLETLARLKELDPDVRAIVSSGYSNDPAMSDPRRFGFRGFVAKPFRLEDLAATLHSVLEGEDA
jgi:PAS domain S-box-containing protein